MDCWTPWLQQLAKPKESIEKFHDSNMTEEWIQIKLEDEKAVKNKLRTESVGNAINIRKVHALQVS